MTTVYGRGVWIAPYRGRKGEMILVALDRQERRLEERQVAFGDDGVRAAEELWVVVEREDPAPDLRLLNPSPRRPRERVSAVPAELPAPFRQRQQPS